MSHRENLLRIKAVYNALEELADEVVFVGGATVSLYTDRVAEEVRPTDDIDGIRQASPMLLTTHWTKGTLSKYSHLHIFSQPSLRPLDGQVLKYSKRPTCKEILHHLPVINITIIS